MSNSKPHFFDPAISSIYLGITQRHMSGSEVRQKPSLRHFIRVRALIIIQLEQVERSFSRVMDFSIDWWMKVKGAG